MQRGRAADLLLDPFFEVVPFKELEARRVLVPTAVSTAVMGVGGWRRACPFVPPLDNQNRSRCTRLTSFSPPPSFSFGSPLEGQVECVCDAAKRQATDVRREPDRSGARARQ